MGKKVDTRKVIIILVGLVALSVLGTAAYYSSTGRLTFKLSPTGMAFSQDAYVTVQVTGTLGITLADNTINLSLHADTASEPGAYVNPTASSATISSDGTAGTNTTGNDGYWLNKSDGDNRSVAQDNISIENNGTVIAKILMECNSTPDQTFNATGGTTSVKGVNWETGSCALGLLDYYRQYGANNTTLCSQLKAGDSADRMAIWVNWTIPVGTATGLRNHTLTIWAEEAL